MPRSVDVVPTCDGGPHDGLEADDATSTFVWIDGRGSCHHAPGPGRALYQRGRDGRWHYTGEGWQQCTGCGAILEPIDGRRLERCQLCGAALSHLPDGEAA